MPRNSSDLRVRRTLKAIRTAFFDLVLEKDYPNISITELTERAEVNRKTFYLHYKSLDDLAQQIVDEIADEILARLEDTAKALDVAGCVAIFYHYINESNEVYRKLLCDPNFVSYYNSVTDRVLQSPCFQRFYEITEHPYIVRAFCVAITSIYRSWLSHGQEFPLEELISYAGVLLLDGYNAVKLG